MGILLRFIVFLLGGALILAFLFVQLPSTQELAKTRLVALIEKQTGYQAEIATLSISPSLQLQAKEVSLYQNGELFLTIEAIQSRIHLWALLDSKVRLHGLHLEGVQLHKLPEGDQEESLLISTIPIPSSSYSFQIDSLKLDRVKVPFEGFPEAACLQGDLLFDPTEKSVLAHFEICLDEEQFKGSFATQGHQGTFKIEKNEDHSLELAFHRTASHEIRIPRFRVIWGLFALDGSLSLLPEGTIRDSELFLTLDDLSEIASLSGRLQGKGRLSGPLFSPDLDILLESEGILAGKMKVEKPQLQLTTKKTDKGISGKLTTQFYTESEAHQISGAIHWEGSEQGSPATLQLRTDLHEIASLFNWDFATMQGDLFLQLLISDQEVRVHAELDKGVIESDDLGSFTSVGGVLEGDLNTLFLNKFFAEDGEGGIYSGSGFVLLDQSQDFPFEASLNIQKGKLISSDHLKCVVDGHLSCSGNAEGATVQGELIARKFKVTLPDKLPESAAHVEITYINQSDLELPPTKIAPESPGLPVMLDVLLSVPKNGIIKGKHLHSEWKGEVRFAGPISKPKAKGELIMHEGKYLFRGKTFELKEGTIAFAGDLEKNTTVYLVAELDLGQIDVQATVKGPLINPSITLRSNPPQSQRAILSWILFNKSVGEVNPMEETQLSHSLKSLTEKAGDKPDLLTRFGRVVGLDRVEIGGSSDPGKGDVTLQLGKYLTEDTYISISGGGQEQAGCLGVEKKFGKHVRFRAEADSESNGRINLLWSKDY